MSPWSCTLWQHPGATAWLGNVSSIQPSQHKTLLSQPLHFPISALSLLPHPHSTRPRACGQTLRYKLLCSRATQGSGVGASLCLWMDKDSPPEHRHPEPTTTLPATPRGRQPHGPDLHTSSKKKAQKPKQRHMSAHSCARFTATCWVGRGASLHMGNLASPAPPWGAQCSPGSPHCTHTHTCTDPGTHNDTWTRGAEPSLAGKQGQTGLWLTRTGTGLGNVLDLPKSHQVSLGAARQTESLAGLAKPR